MLKKSIAVIFSILYIASFVGATVNITHRWEGNGISVSMTDNYGTPLGERIRRENQSEKGYHIFNLLRASGKKTKLNIYPSPHLRLQEGEGFVSSLDVGEVEKVLAAEISKPEEFSPVFSENKLFYLKWDDGMLELMVNGLSIYQSVRAFNLIGKKKESILIRVDGELMYLSEVDWVPVKSLTGFTVDLVKWIDNDRFVCYVERNVDGERFIARTSIRQPEQDLLIPAARGKFLDVIVSDEGEIYSLNYDRGSYKISKYVTKLNKWVVREEFQERIYLIGVKGGRLIWWDAGAEEIVLSDGTRIGGIKAAAITSYPRGRYEYGETKDNMKVVEPRKVKILFYSKKVSAAIKGLGFNEIEKLETNPEVWIFPEKYSAAFNLLPENIGYVYFSPEDMKIYYDFKKNNLRNINSIKIVPSVTGKYIIIFIVGLLIMLVLWKIVTIQKPGARIQESE